MSKSRQLPPRRSSALRTHIRDLALQPVKRYVDIQRERGQLLTIDKVDVDLEQMVERTFLCDRHRCIQWTPHEKKKDARALIDNSCCSRYSVPVTDLDRRKLSEILPAVRKRLARNHPLVEDQTAPPYEIDDDFAFVMKEQPGGACQFVLYEAGMTTCAIHKTCLEEGLDVWEYKPLGCSLWPLALVDYDDDGQTRYLLTIYARATANLFTSNNEDGTQDDEAHFACLVDQDPKYDPLYKSMEGIISYALGADFYKKLDKHVSKHAQKR
jgi:hypothetical protein